MADGGGAAPVARGDSPGIFLPRRGLIETRDMEPGEEDLLGAVFFRSVHHCAASAYSVEEREAWAPQAPSGAAWAERLAGQVTLVAEVDGRVCGFMSLEPKSSYLDFAFVEKRAKGTGVAAALYAVLENRARAAGLTKLFSDASHLAKPFFARQGWVCVCAQTVERRGVTLSNWRMEKELG